MAMILQWSNVCWGLLCYLEEAKVVTDPFYYAVHYVNHILRYPMSTAVPRDTCV